MSHLASTNNSTSSLHNQIEMDSLRVWMSSEDENKIMVSEPCTNWVCISPSSSIPVPILTNSAPIPKHISRLFNSNGPGLFELYSPFLTHAEHLMTSNQVSRSSNALQTSTDVQELSEAISAQQVSSKVMEQRRSRSIHQTKRARHLNILPVADDEWERTEVCEWSNIVTLLLTLLETKMSDSSCMNMDIPVSVKRRTRQGGMCLIRPDALSDVCPLFIVLAMKKWRRRRSMHASLLKITIRHSIDEVNTSDLDISCSCDSFLSISYCEHVHSVGSKTSNRLRIQSFAHRMIDVSNYIQPASEWSFLRLPTCENDDTDVWIIFLRRMLSSRFRTTSVVLFDRRANVYGKKANQRVQCVICRGTANNRSLCLHEKTVAQEISSTTMIHEEQLQAAENDLYFSNEEANEIENVSSRERELSYTSSRHRSFFPCASDEKAMR